MVPTSPRQPWEVNRLERDRPLTRREIDLALADHQTALRHATAAPSLEMAEQLRDELLKHERASVEERLDALVTDLGKTESHELRRAGAVVEAALTLVRVWAARNG